MSVCEVDKEDGGLDLAIAFCDAVCSLLRVSTGLLNGCVNLTLTSIGST